MLSAPGVTPKGGMDPDWFAIRLKAIQSFSWFEKNVIGNDAIDSKYGFHRDLASFVSRPRRERKAIAMVLAPRGFLKSTIGNIDHSIWCLLRDCNERIMIMHGIETKAKSYLDEIEAKIRTNKVLQKIAPDIFGKIRTRGSAFLWVSRTVEDKVPSISAFGMGSATSGHHYTRYKLDDLVNDSNYMTVAGLEEPIKKFQDVMSTRRNLRSFVDIFATVYAHADLSQWIQDKENHWWNKIDVWHRPCWYTGPKPDGDGNFTVGDESWWPEEKPVEFLYEQMGLGAIKFAQQYLCEPAVEGTYIFAESWIRRYEPHFEDDELVLPGTRGDDPSEARNWKLCMSLDGVSGTPTGHQSRGQDRACILVGAKNDLGDLYLIDIYYDRPAQGAWHDIVHQFWCKWRTDRMKMERTGVAAALWNALEEDARRRGARYPLVKSARQVGGYGYDAKTKRFEALQGFVARGQLWIPNGEKWKKPLREMIDFQYGIKNQHDDFLDCVYDLWDEPAPPAPSKINRCASVWRDVGALAREGPRGLGIREVARRR
jgi:predicted phage terminase large subunit-like protein